MLLFLVVRRVSEYIFFNIFYSHILYFSVKSFWYLMATNKSKTILLITRCIFIYSNDWLDEEETKFMRKKGRIVWSFRNIFSKLHECFLQVGLQTFSSRDGAGISRYLDSRGGPIDRLQFVTGWCGSGSAMNPD